MPDATHFYKVSVGGELGLVLDAQPGTGIQAEGLGRSVDVGKAGADPVLALWGDRLS